VSSESTIFGLLSIPLSFSLNNFYAAMCQEETLKNKLSAARIVAEIAAVQQMRGGQAML